MQMRAGSLAVARSRNAYRLDAMAIIRNVCLYPFMNERVKHLSDEAAKLSAQDRIALIERLQASLDPVDPSIETESVDEGERRLDAHLSGGMTSRDAGEVLSKYLKP